MQISENSLEAESGPPSSRCAYLRDVLSRIGDKWTIFVVGALSGGPLRFNQLKRQVEGISQRMLTRTLRAGLRQTDFAARYGGDEFVILLPFQTPAEALTMVERLRRAISGLEVGIRLSISAGIAGHTPEAPMQSGEALLGLADAALYQAKRGGRNRVVVLDSREALGETRV